MTYHSEAGSSYSPISPIRRIKTKRNMVAMFPPISGTFKLIFVCILILYSWDGQAGGKGLNLVREDIFFPSMMWRTTYPILPTTRFNSDQRFFWSLYFLVIYRLCRMLQINMHRPSSDWSKFTVKPDLSS